MPADTGAEIGTWKYLGCFKTGSDQSFGSATGYSWEECRRAAFALRTHEPQQFALGSKVGPKPKCYIGVNLTATDRKPEELCLKFDREGHKHGDTDDELAVYERITDSEVILVSSVPIE